METDRLKYFCVIVDTGSLTKAAEVLGVSHSGLSKAMSVLQDELGFKILIPKGRGLELTEKGRELYENSRKILEMVNGLKQDKTFSITSIRLAVPESLALATAESIATEIKEGITIDDLDSGEIEARILDRRIDFGFTFIPFPDKDLDHLKIASIHLASFANVNAFRGEDPDAIPYVIPSSELKENPLSLKIRDGWNSTLTRQTPFRANSLSIALKMVQAGECAIYVPKFVVNQLNARLHKDYQLAELDLSPARKNKERSQRNVFFVKRASEDESKIMKRVVKVIRQICKD
jgi:DNA-binding transcriptional LysR family regulator